MSLPHLQSRVNVDPSIVSKVLADVSYAITAAVTKHGAGSFISKHEILGVLIEETDELREAVREDGSLEPFLAELFDIAVSSVFGIASLRASQPAAQPGMDLLRSAAGDLWREPHITYPPEGGMALEWAEDDRRMTVFLDGNDSEVITSQLGGRGIRCLPLNAENAAEGWRFLAGARQK